MTNQEKEESGQIPPKIKLKKPDGSAASKNGGQPGDSAPEARPIGGPKSDTSRVNLPEEAPRQAEEQARHDETMRVVLPRADDIETATLRKKSFDKPKKTIKIVRPEFLKAESSPDKPQPAEEAAHKPDQIKTIAQARPVLKPKEDTSRIDMSKAQTPPSQAQVDTAKDDTMRVILEESSEKGDSGRLDITAKPPRTVRIKRDGVDLTGAETAVDTQENKSKTAKLDLPDAITDQPSGKKTIRIKRSGGEPGEGAGRTLKISRPESVKAAPLSAAAEATRASLESRSTEQPPHAIFAIAAMLAVIISGVLIYLLCTHMPFGSSLPWPGKIVMEWQGPTNMI